MRPSRRGALIVLVAAAAGSVALLAASWRNDAAADGLRFRDDVPADLRALAGETWERFAATFAGRADCFEPPRLAGAWELDDRARYEPATATVEVRIPATAAHLETSLVHEFAHHLDLTCPDIEAIRPAFLAAQGLPADADWRAGPVWEEIPAEHFAETVTEAVLGRRTSNLARIRVSDDAVVVVTTWADG